MHVQEFPVEILNTKSEELLLQRQFGSTHIVATKQQVAWPKVLHFTLSWAQTTVVTVTGEVGQDSNNVSSTVLKC